MSTMTRIRKKDLLRLKKIAKKRGVSVSQILSEVTKDLGGEKVGKKETEDFDICDNCGYNEVPKRASFCPGCGAEFEEEEEEEDEEEES